MARVEIALLGRFAVAIDGRTVGDEEWTRPPAASLVKFLALAPGRRAHREQVIDALWPDLPVDDAAPRLHKAAHYARKALGERGRLTIRAEVVALFPSEDVVVDVQLFERAAQRALAADAPAGAVDEALALYGGELLPQDAYDEWTQDARRHLGALQASLLRAAGRWEQLVALDPSDEVAHLHLMEGYAQAGDRAAALRQFERLEHALRQELGVAPGRPAQALRAQLLAADPLPAGASAVQARPDRLVGGQQWQSRVAAVFQEASNARGRTLLVHGVPGVGKSALLDWMREDARARGWRSGSGVAAEVEGAWPYAPVLEALADLARAHPTLMDALDDAYREEIERALGGGEQAHWSGDGGHQRLFFAAAELLRVAAAGTGTVLFVDDVHEADEASLRLLHYLARAAANERAVLVLAHRPASHNDALQRVRGSLLARQTAVDVPLAPLTAQGTATLLATALGRDPDDELASYVHSVSAGIPRRTLQIAQALRNDDATPVPADGAADLTRLGVGSELRDALRQVAVLGTHFDTDEFVAVATLDDESAYTLLDTALAAGVLERTDAGFRMQSVTRDELLLDLPQHRLHVLQRNAADALIGLGGSPARIGHHLMAAGDAHAAVPHILAAAETAAGLGAYRDALGLVESVRAVAGATHRARLLRMRADLMLAVGDPGAVAAFREAVGAAAPSELPGVRARLSRAAVLAGDLDSAREALAGIDENAPAEVPVLLAKGSVAYFSGDLDGAAAAVREASALGTEPQNWDLPNLISLQGLIAHDRGEWFTRLYHELRQTKEAPAIATAVFDSHLCVAEYLLYGPTPYDEVLALAADLRQTAHRAGALRAVAFATTLLGEAALLSGDLAVAEKELLDAVDLHRDIGAPAGEAHSLQRLAELHLVRGDRVEARSLLHRALPLARWSLIAPHLLQRIHGTLVRAADDAASARDMVDRAEAILGTEDFCTFCQVMFSVPAAIACAQAGDVPAARHQLEMARRSAALWQGTAWEAATLEAEAHVVLAEGDEPLARQLLAEARSLFEAARQPLDAARCSQPLAATPQLSAAAATSGK